MHYYSKYRIMAIEFCDGTIMMIKYRKPHTIAELKAYNKKRLQEDYDSLYFYQNEDAYYNSDILADVTETGND